MDSDPVFASNDAIFLADGTLLKTHHDSMCSGHHCSIHNPSDHPLRDAPLNWRDDYYLMERICPHGIGHPDPDDLAHKKRVMTSGEYDNHAFGVHGCDRCCHWPAEDKDEME